MSWIYVVAIFIFSSVVSSFPTRLTHVYAFQNETLVLTCNINSTEKVAITWEKNGEVLNASDSSYIINQHLTIKSFSNSSRGVYTCTYKSYGSLEYVHRGLPIVVNSFSFPKFTLFSKNIPVNATSILQCCKSDVFSREYDVHWFKNNQPLIPNKNIVIINNLLILTEIQYDSQGKYKCEIVSKNISGAGGGDGNVMKTWNVVNSSKEVNVDIKKEVNVRNQVDIIFLSPSQDILLQEQFTIICIANQLHDISLLKKSKYGKGLLKLAENKGMIVYKINKMMESDGGDYICEVEDTSERVSRDMNVNVIDNLILDNNAIEQKKVFSKYKFDFKCNPKNMNSFKSIQWYHNNQLLSNYNNKTKMTVQYFGSSDVGMYQCFVNTDYISETKQWLIWKDTTMLPLNVTVDVIDDREVNLHWEPPLGNTTKSIHYKIIRQCQPYSGNTYLDIVSKPGWTGLLCPLCGGMQCKFEVCPFIFGNDSISDCDHVMGKMFTGLPVLPPTLHPPKLHYRRLKLNWDPIHIGHSKGIIQNYTIFLQHFSGDEKYKLGYLETFNVSDRKQITYPIQLPYYGIYKVWVLATNLAGNSPNSKAYLIDTDEYEEETEIVYVKLKGAVKIKTKGDKAVAFLRWDMTEEFAGWTKALMIYITKLPYSNYWNATTSVKVSADTRKYKFKGLSTKYSYRITLVPIYSGRDAQTRQEYVEAGAYIEHYFLPNDTFNNVITKNLDPGSKFNWNPRSFLASPLTTTSILFTWSPPWSITSKYTYALYVVDEQTNIETVVYTNETFIVIDKLYHYWYHARLQAVYDPDDGMNQTTDYITCSTKLQVPTPVQELTYNVIHHRADKSFLVWVKFKIPEYTGNSVYYFHVRSQKVVAPNVRFFLNFLHSPVIVDSSQLQIAQDGYIVTKPFKAMFSSRYQITVTAINFAGESDKVMVETEELLVPNVSTALQEITTKDTELPYSFQIKLGVVIGISVTLFFFLIFIAVCCLYKCCTKPIKSVSSSSLSAQQHHQLLPHTSSETDPFLYLQKLNQEDRFTRRRHDQVDTISIDSDTKGHATVCIPILSKNKYINPVGRLWNQRKLDKRKTEGSALYTSSGSSNSQIINGEKLVSFPNYASNQQDLSKSTVSSIEKKSSPHRTLKIGESSSICKK